MSALADAWTATAAHPVIVAIVSGLVSGVGSSILTSKLQHHFWKKQHIDQSRTEKAFWKLQRADELRLEAAKAFNHAMHAYLACCVTQADTTKFQMDGWLRDLNVAAGVIRTLFSD